MNIASLTGMTESENGFSPSSQELMNAFAMFTRASEALEGVHGRLLQQIEYLSQELEESNAKLRASLRETEAMRNELLHILESQPNGVLVLGRESKVIHCNRRARELLDLDPERPVGRMEELTENRQCSDFFRAGLEFPEREAAEEISLRDDAGKVRRHLVITSSPLHDTARKAAGVIVVIHDDTQRKRLEEENNRQEKLAAMGGMAAQLSHEIRNPLSSIGLYASLIHESQAELAPARKWCRQIEAAVNTLNTLVTNMLHLARPTPNISEDLDLHAVLEGVLEFALPLLDANRISLQTSWQAGCPRILGHSESLRQMMLNLLLNAIQAMPDGGRIRVETQQESLGQDSQRLQLKIADTGIGVDPEILPRFFEPGFSQRRGGTGLGLWIVGQILENHRAQMAVTSVRGKGTEFLISFPCQAPDHASRPAVGAPGIFERIPA